MAKSHLGRLCALLKAEVAETYTEVDVLVCATASGTKYNLALARGVPTVGEAWLLACAADGQAREPALWPPPAALLKLAPVTPAALAAYRKPTFATRDALHALQSPVVSGKSGGRDGYDVLYEDDASKRDAGAAKHGGQSDGVLRDHVVVVTSNAATAYPTLATQLQQHGGCEQLAMLCLVVSLGGCQSLPL